MALSTVFVAVLLVVLAKADPNANDARNFVFADTMFPPLPKIPGFKPFEPMFHYIPPTFKPITPLDPDTLSKIKPEKGKQFSGISISTSSFSSNVNGKVTSGGSMRKVDNINGKVQEEHFTFGDAKPE